MKHEYNEGPETWQRFTEGMKKLFQAPKPPPKEKPETKRKDDSKS
jgi:hypothetical protein